MKLTAAQVYDKAIAEANEAYDVARLAAWEVYGKACAEADKIYKKSYIDNAEQQILH